MASRPGLQTRVPFPGSRQDVAALMRAADLCVVPSRYEACSRVLLEAMASGPSVITARTAGAAELVCRDFGVIVEDPQGVEAISAALQALRGDPERGRRMSSVARKVAEGYSRGRMALAWPDLCDALAARGHGS